MPKRSDRSRKKKFRRKASGKSKRYFAKKKSGKHSCALCGSHLHGVPHGKGKAKVRKMEKSKRRPTGTFGGVLCSKCREKVFEEAAKVAGGAKEKGEVEVRLKRYVEAVEVG